MFCTSGGLLLSVWQVYYLHEQRIINRMSHFALSKQSKKLRIGNPKPVLRSTPMVIRGICFKYSFSPPREATAFSKADHAPN